MTEPKLNPHEQAVIELEYWEATGIRHVFDSELATIADLYPSKFYKNKEQDNETNN